MEIELDVNWGVVSFWKAWPLLWAKSLNFILLAAGGAWVAMRFKPWPTELGTSVLWRPTGFFPD